MAKTISQDMIQEVMYLEKTLDVLIMGIRRRVQSGAAVEPGKWRLSDDGTEIAVDDEAVGCYRLGLNIIAEDAVSETPRACRQWLQ